MMTIDLKPPRQKNDEPSIVDVSSSIRQIPIAVDKNKRPILVYASVALLVSCIIGAVAWKFLGERNGSLLAAPTVAALPNIPATSVRVFIVGSRSAKAFSQSLTGIVRARHETQLAFRIGGKIRKRLVEVGQAVTKGQVLFELDDEDYDLQVQSALANLEVAKASVQRTVADEKRLQELLRARAISPSEYEKALADRDVAQGQRQSAEKQLELANNQLTYCRLTADEAGIMTSIDAEAGQVVAAGTRVGSLAQTQELEAVVDIPENRLPKTADVETSVEFWSIPGLMVPAKLREISPIADPMTRTFRARFSLLNLPEQVKLGMTASVSLVDQAESQTVIVPLNSIVSKSGQPCVWLLDEAEASIAAKPVTIAKYGEGHAFLSSGVKLGDKIVSAGVQKLDEGLKVRVWEIQP